MSIQFSTKRVDQIEKVPEKFQFHVAAAVGVFLLFQATLKVINGQ